MVNLRVISGVSLSIICLSWSIKMLEEQEISSISHSQYETINEIQKKEFLDIIDKAANNAKFNGSLQYIETELTLEKSHALLERNQSSNRKVRTLHLRNITKDMMTPNAWKLNGEPIIVDFNGQMLSGQHRCLARIAANNKIAGPIKVTICVGVNPNARDTVDNNKPWKPGDRLKSQGYGENVNAFVQAMRYELRYREGSGIPQKTFTDVEIQSAVRDNIKELERDFSYIPHDKMNNFPMPFRLFFFRLTCKVAPRETCKEFLTGIITSENVADPIRRAHDVIHGSMLREGVLSRTNINANQVLLAYLMKTWNLWCKGEQFPKNNVTPSIRKGDFPQLLSPPNNEIHSIIENR